MQNRSNLLRRELDALVGLALPAGAFALAFALTLGGCSLLDGDSSSDTEESATLSAVSPSTESGTATLTNTGSSTTQIAITTTGGTATDVQSVSIHSGTCGSDGAVLVILNELQEDTSVTTIDYALSSLTGSKYYIEIDSATDIDAAVACGEIP